MDLVVAGVDVVAGDQSRVVHPAVVCGGEHACHDQHTVLLCDRSNGLRPWPVERFSNRGQRCTEPGHHGLGEHDDTCTLFGCLACAVPDQLDVLIGLVARRHLTQCETWHVSPPWSAWITQPMPVRSQFARPYPGDMPNRIDLRGHAPSTTELRGLLPRAEIDVDAVLDQVRPVVAAVRATGTDAAL